MNQIVKTTFPLSYGQEAMWLISQIAPDNIAYNIFTTVKINFYLNFATVNCIWQKIIEHHPILRTIYTSNEGQPVQQINQEYNFNIDGIDASNWNEDYLKDKIFAITDRPFNLGKDLVLRVDLFTRSAKEHILLLTMHHIAGDMWSFDLLLSEFQALYAKEIEQASQEQIEAALDSLTKNKSYVDFVHWQSEMLSSARGEKLWQYWQKQLAGELPILNLPMVQPQPPVQTYRIATHIFKLDEKLIQELKNLALTSGTSLYKFLLAAFFILLYRYTNAEDILVGSLMTGRGGKEEFKEIVGYFLNPVILRTSVSGNRTFKDFLSHISSLVKEAQEHQDYPFSLLVKQLQQERDPRHSPLLQVSFTWQKQRWYEPGKPSSHSQMLQMEPYLLGHQRGAISDLDVSVMEASELLQVCWQYNTDIFDASTIARMAGHFHTLLEGLTTNPEQQISELPLLTQTEHHQLLFEWNNTWAEYPKDKCIHQLFEEQVERSPDAVAVVFEGEQLTYRELNAKANQLANYLQTLGVKPEVLVSICVERSLEILIGLLSIVKAGGAYVPLDPAYPPERLAFMLEDSCAPVLLTKAHIAKTLPIHSSRVVYLDRDWEEIYQHSEKNPTTKVTPDNLAYVIYTSGSTGNPKGVLIEHRGLLNLVFWHLQAFSVSSADRATQLAGPAFDASVWELWPYLAVGASIYIANEQTRIVPKHLQDWLIASAITISFVPTPLAENLLLLDWSADVALRILLTGGDKLHNYPLPKVPFELVNNYGPTENTVVTTSGSIPARKRTDMAPPIGRPIANTQVYLLDENLQPVATGVPGELYIGGDGLARGYLNRPDLTLEKFIPNPFSSNPGERLYKTGDKARYLSDGNIEFLSRIDNQVKIRGFRIELGEIEAILRQHRVVLDTVVVLREDVSNRKYLVAYVVPRDSSVISRSELRGFLKEKLPDYMIPGVFVMLDALPLTPNGKVDRQALDKHAEMIDLHKSDANLSHSQIDIPTLNQPKYGVLRYKNIDSILSTLRSLIAKLLHIEIDEVDVSTTFLELGMDSLLLLEAMRIIQTTFGVEVEAQQFFEDLETIDALATYIEENMPLEPSGKTYRENELYPISEQESNLEVTVSLPQLAQPKALSAPVNELKDKAKNKANRDREQQTNIEKIIAQQLQLMSQQLEILRAEEVHKERSHDEKATFIEFASPKSCEQSVTVTNPSPVCSYNEWDPLEEVIVGIVDGAMIPSWHTIHRATVLPGQEKQMESLSKRTQKQPLPYPEWLVQAASKCVEEFAHILESEGVIVRRPDIVDYSASFRTPSWEVMNGFCAANPRDVFLVIGNEIIEAPMADRTRYFESWAYRSLLKEYLKGGAQWIAAPKPQLLDAQYDPDYKAPALGEEMRFAITEFEPTFDAADFVRFGRDIFVQKSHVTNSLGIEWVRRHLGDEYRVHEVQSLCPQALHIDTTLVPLAPGKVLVNPLFIDVDNLPDYFKSWDILLAPKPNRTPMTLYDTKVISQWVNMNVLSLDEERVIVEKSQESMIKALKDWGFKPIPCEFESYYPFMGSFHCATLDVRRRGVLRSYEMEEGAL